MAALGAPAAQHGSTRLGLHPGKKPVGLRAMAAVRLEGALRHLDQTPAQSICGLQQSLSIPQKPLPTQRTGQGKRLCALRSAPESTPRPGSKPSRARRTQSIFTRNGAMKFLSPDHLNSTWSSVLISDPLTKDDFPFVGVSHFGSRCRFSSQWGRLEPSRRSPATGLDLNRLWVARDSCCHCS